MRTATTTTITTLKQKDQPSLSCSVQQTCTELLENPEKVLLLDGGTGEELFRRNVPDDRTIWSATALVHPEYHPILEQVHTSFLQSGSNFITTNSYGVVPGVGFKEEEITTYLQLAGQIARQAVINYYDACTWTRTEQQEKEEILLPRIHVLGSLGPLVESYRPDLIKPHL
jgi:S-methylmethionine-dependent homocysteine/selenocysteine methylase